MDDRRDASPDVFWTGGIPPKKGVHKAEVEGELALKAHVPAQDAVPELVYPFSVQVDPPPLFVYAPVIAETTPDPAPRPGVPAGQFLAHILCHLGCHMSRIGSWLAQTNIDNFRQVDFLPHCLDDCVMNIATPKEDVKMLSAV